MMTSEKGAHEAKRLVLGFDAGCFTCNDLASRIEERVGDKLAVRDLKDPEVHAWRREILGEDAKWTPTLFEIGDGTVRAWAGWRMGWALSRRLGPVDTWRVMQALGEVGAAPKKEMSAFAEALTRGQFLKGVGGAALAATALTTAGGALASSAHAAERSRFAAQAGKAREEITNMDRAVSLMEQHMRVSKGGTLTLDDKGLARDIRAGAAKGIEQEVFDELKESLGSTNSQIRGGDLKVKEVFPTANSEFVGDAALTSRARCRGRSGRRFYWWGVRLYLNSCNVNTLRLAFAGYISLATLCEKVPFTYIPCRVISAILGMSWGWIEYVNNRGGNDGLVFQKNWAAFRPRVYSQ